MKVERVPDARCDHCAITGAMNKSLHVVKLPQTLVIGLKRWVLLADGRVRKSDVAFDFYEKWKPCGNVEYVLKGAVVHTGVVGGGHYTAFVADGGRWTFYDDAVKPAVVSTDTVLRSVPYMLWYEQLAPY